MENDSARIISVQTPSEVDYWCEELSCCEKDLRDAISKVGHSFAAVDAYLYMNLKKQNNHEK